MRAFEEVLGKIIIDANGNEIGKIDDIEIDFGSSRVEAMILKGKGSLAKQLQTDKLASLMEKLRITPNEDLLIPFDDVQAIGKYVVLKRVIEQNNEPSPSIPSEEQA